MESRLEYGAQGVNPRFIVSHLPASDYSAQALYDGLYCQRGEAENRIKETQLDLFGARASCQRFKANPFRMLLAALACTLMLASAHPLRETFELAARRLNAMSALPALGVP